MRATAIGAGLATLHRPPLHAIAAEVLAAARGLPGLPDQTVALMACLLFDELLDEPPPNAPVIGSIGIAHSQPLS